MKKIIIILVVLWSSQVYSQTTGTVTFYDLDTTQFRYGDFGPGISINEDLLFTIHKDSIKSVIINPPVFKPSLDFGISTGLAEYENQETVFVIDSKEVLRFYEDSIILYFKGKTIVITDDSLCNTLDRITEETFSKY